MRIEFEIMEFACEIDKKTMEKVFDNDTVVLFGHYRDKGALFAESQLPKLAEPVTLAPCISARESFSQSVVHSQSSKDRAILTSLRLCSAAPACCFVLIKPL